VNQMPVQTTTDVGVSGTERSRRLRVGILTSVLSRFAGLAAPVIIIPLVIDQLGEELSGVWLTVTSLTSVLLWADLGLGNGLLTRLSSSVARGNLGEARGLIAVSYTLLGSFALLACAALLSSVDLVPWANVLNASDPEVKWIVVLQLGMFMVNVPLSLIQRVQYALQEVGMSNLIMLVAPVITIAGAVTAHLADFSALRTIACISVGQPIASLIATVVTFSRHRELFPSLSDATLVGSGQFLSLGAGFLAVQSLSALALNFDNLIIAHTAGIARVTDFAVVARVFGTLGLLVTMVNLPLWPANAEALARGDHAWVVRATGRMTAVSSASMVVGGVALVMFGPWLIREWVGDEIHVSSILIVGFSTLWLVIGLASPSFMLLNAQGKVVHQMVAWSLFVVMSGLTKIALGSSGHVDLFPMAGAAWYAILLLPVAMSGWVRLRHDVRSGS
jgi:O-antigen/teichoic acid export membrane protein